MVAAGEGPVLAGLDSESRVHDARESRFGRLYALVLGMSVPDLSGRAVANLGVEKLSHIAPVHHGDTLDAWSGIVERRRSRSHPENGIVTVDTWGVNQHDERVIAFRRAFMVPCREERG